MMFTIKRIYEIAVLLSMAVILSQCSTVHRETGLPLSDLKPEQIESEIKRLEEVSNKHVDRSERAKAHLQLATLYSSYKNPKPNYQQALKELEEYLSFNPETDRTDEIENWSALLNEMVRMTDEIRKAKQKINQLTKENKELKDAVEKLKDLDIKMEEKRKQLE